MKKMKLLPLLLSVFFIGTASAADITIYYSPSCPHCHHAQEFFANKMIYEYPKLRVVQVNVMKKSNLDMFKDALAKCEYTSGGVPVIVVGDKCFQGYADFMQKDLRDAVELDLSKKDKEIAAENKKSLEKDPENFRAKHPERKKAISEYSAGVNNMEKKTNNQSTLMYLYVLLIVLVAAFGLLLIRKGKKK